jgi:hypothetical protein
MVRSLFSMTRPRKLLLWFVVLPALLILFGVGLLFVPAVQTFVVQRALASQSQVKAQVDAVAVTLGGANLRGLRFEQPGLLVTAPSLEADVPLHGLASRKIELTLLVAHDVAIVIDPSASAADALANPRLTAATPAQTSPFAGLLKALALPASLRAGGVDIAGTIRVLGAQPIEAAFTLKGGGIAAGSEGAFTLTLNASAKQGKLVSELLLRPALGADGQLTALSAVLNATAESASLATPAKLQTELAITRAGEGETYRLRIATDAAPLVELTSSWAPGATQTPGRWLLAFTDADLRPFLLGTALPTFSAKGEGELSAASAERFRIGGQLAVAADAPSLGPVNADLRFALEMNAGQPRIEALSLTVSGATSPVLSVEVRQPFGFDFAAKKIHPSRPDSDLCDVVLLGLPSAWLKSYLPAGLALGGPITGAWIVHSEDEGFIAAASAPLLVPGLRMDGPAGPQWVFDAVRVEGIRTGFSPAGFTARVERLRLQRNGEDVVSASVELARKPAASLTAKGELRAALVALTAQPALSGAGRLSGGTANLSFDASAGDTLTAKALLNLVGLRAGSAGELPEVTLNAEVSREADGVLTAKLPITLRNNAASRTSDLELSATLTPKEGGTQISARVFSQNLHVPDLQIFAALAPATPPVAASPPASDNAATKPAAVSAPAANPVWAGYGGELALSLARVVYAPGVVFTKIEGKVALTPDTLSLQGLKAALGDGRLSLGGALNFVRPAGSYDLACDVSVRDLPSGPLLRALSPTQAVPLEGVFSLDATLAGQGSDPAAAAKAAAGEVKVTGKNGVIRALNFESNRYAKAGSALAGLAGLAGALSGNSQLAERGAQLTALNSVARQLGQLPFDDIVLFAKRGSSGELEISNLTLHSPQLTLAGSGAIANRAGRGFADQPLLLSMKLGARGDMASALQTLGLLAPVAADSPPDAFLPLTDPLVFDGSLRQVGTKQATRLLARALSL